MLSPILCEQQQVIVRVVLGLLNFVLAVSIQFQAKSDVAIHFILKAHEEKAAPAEILDRTNDRITAEWEKETSAPTVR